MTARIDVLGIGNAIVDVLAHCDDDFLTAHKMAKGAMQLVDEDQAEQLYQAMGSGVEISGGSAANTMVGLASFGGKTAYIGKVRDDQLGEVFRHDIKAAGVGYDLVSANSGPASARCLVLVTPDGERTMNTFLGASIGLTAQDIDAELVRSAGVIYLEGYLWDPEEAKKAFIRAADIAREANRKVSLTLSDAFCVERHRDSFLDLIRGKVDILFANESEIQALYQSQNMSDITAQLRKDCRLAVVTRSAQGSLIIAGDESHEVPAKTVQQVVDTTGAGDLFAAGFLYGISTGQSLPVCGQLGALAASEIISHIGARPEQNMHELAKSDGII